MIPKLSQVKEWRIRTIAVLQFFFGGTIGIGSYRAADLARIVDDIHNRMYFELMLKNFVLAQRNSLTFDEFKQEQIKAAQNWNFIKISRWPIRVSWKDFTDPYINVMDLCHSYKDVFRLLIKALPDLRLALNEYAKLKIELYDAEEDLLFWVSQNQEKLLSNHQQNCGIHSDLKFEKVDKWLKDKETCKKTMDFLMAFRLHYLDSEQDLAVKLENHDLILRSRIYLLNKKREKNEKRLKSLLKRRKTIREKNYYNPENHPGKHYPKEKFNWWFLKPRKKTEIKK